VIADFVLRVDKARGPTSHDVVDDVRRLFRTRRVGHAGTLDPEASGLLLVLVGGRATKIAPFLAELDKTYTADVHLGVATDSGDVEGAVTAEMPVPADLAARLPAVLARFRGAIQQVPPMASAIKVGGEPLHRLRRAGLEVARPPRTVVVERLQVLAVALAANPPLLRLEIACGKGTYIRTLAADLAQALGTCGHLAALRRDSIGAFTLAGAVPSQGLRARDPAAVLATAGVTPSAALAHLPVVVLDADAAYAVRHGMPPRLGNILALDRPLAAGDLARLAGPDGELVAVVAATSPLTGRADGAPADPAPLRYRRVLVGRDGA
jgi:tRNA pseudouridine55 synthase